VDLRRPKGVNPLEDEFRDIFAGGFAPPEGSGRSNEDRREWEEEGSPGGATNGVGGATKTEGDANRHSPLAKPGSARTAKSAVSSKPLKSPDLGLLEPG